MKLLKMCLMALREMSFEIQHQKESPETDFGAMMPSISQWETLNSKIDCCHPLFHRGSNVKRTLTEVRKANEKYMFFCN